MTRIGTLVLALACLSSTSLADNSIENELEPNEFCATDQYPPPEEDRVPRYVINLDLPAEDRWTALMSDKKEAATVLLQTLKNYTATFFGDRLFDYVDKYLPLVAKTLPEPYRSEMKGVAAATGLTYGEITLYNIFYEVFTFCTSIVAEDASGLPRHGRNLDFGLFLGWDATNHTWLTTEALRPLVVHLDFQRDDRTVYRTVSFAGYVGVLTGLKPHRFSLSLDERFSLDGGYIGILRWLLGDRSAHWAGFLMRSVLEEADGFDAAVERLAGAKLLAPVYFIVGGNATSQGAVITRGRTDADVWRLGDPSTDSTGVDSNWYLVETNYDHWKAVPFFDDRRGPAKRCLERTGRADLSAAAIYNVLSTKPVLNKLTTYTALMDVTSGRLDAWLRYCPEPCQPW